MRRRAPLYRPITLLLSALVAVSLTLVPTAAQAADPVDPNWIVSVDFTPDVIGADDLDTPTTVTYAIQVQTTCADFDFEAECDSFTFRGNYLEIYSPSFSQVARDGFTFNRNGIASGSFEIPAGAEGGTWYVTLAMYRGANYGDSPTFSNLQYQGQYLGDARIPEGSEDSIVVLAGCSGCGLNAPVAADDTFATTSGSTLTVPSPGVLANDTDVDGDLTEAALVTEAANGTAVLAADGSFTYTPDAGFLGTDTFTYEAVDAIGHRSAPATVSVEVSATPIANDDSFATDEGVTLTVSAPGVLENDTDADGDLAGAAILGEPAHGSVDLAADGSFSYAPDAGFVGTDTFTYTAQDAAGHTSEPATVSIEVSEVAAPDPVSQVVAALTEVINRLPSLESVLGPVIARLSLAGPGKG